MQFGFFSFAKGGKYHSHDTGQSIEVILKVDHEFFLLLQLTILAPLKLTRAKAQNIIFVASAPKS
jgi:hypothetical protein